MDPWCSKIEVIVGPIEPKQELRVTPLEYLRFIDQARSKKLKTGSLVENMGNVLIHRTRFNYFDRQNHIGLACGEYNDLNVLQNIKRFILQPDVGYMVDERGKRGVVSMSTKRQKVDVDDDDDDDNSDLDDNDELIDMNSDDNCESDNDDNNEEKEQEDHGLQIIEAEDETGANTCVMHSDLYRRQIPLQSISRFLDMPIFNGNKLKNVVQSGKSVLYYLLTYLLANCMRMYVLPGPKLPCFSAVLPLHALCTIFDLNIDALPSVCLRPIGETAYAYLAESLRVKYMFVFPPNLSFLDRRDPVIHDGGIDTCDKLFLTDDEYSDFRVNCTMNCRNRNEDYDGDTNNPGFCKGIESHTEIKYNMRTQLMPLLRARHNFSQNILYRLFVILALDKHHDASFDLVVRDPTKSITRDLYENVLRVISLVDVIDNPDAARRALTFFGTDDYAIYYMFIRRNISEVKQHVREFDGWLSTDAVSLDDSDELDAAYLNVLYKIDGVWKASNRAATSNCFCLLDNMLRTMTLMKGDRLATLFVDRLLRTVHDKMPRVFSGEEPLCFTTIVNVLSRAKGDFHDILSLQRDFESRRQQINWFVMPRSLMDLLQPLNEQKLQQNKQYLDNFVDGSKKVPRDSKQTNSTKWTLQNVIYHEGALYVDGDVLLDDCMRVFSYGLFLDIDLTCAIFEPIVNKLYGVRQK